jgi:hypothetical protein
MFEIKRSETFTLPIFCHDANGDAVTGLVDGGFTKRIRYHDGSWGAMTVTITEQENGWYGVPLSAVHTGTSGILTMTFTHASIKQVNAQFRVSERITDDLAYPATSGRPITVTSAGEASINLDGTVGTLAKDTDITGFEAYTAARGGYIDELAAANIPANVDTLLTRITAAIATKAEMDTAHALLATVAKQDIIDGIVDNILLDTAELQTDDVPGLIAALNNLSAADVNAQVLDVIQTDTFAQPGQEAPAATQSILKMLQFLYKEWRNKTTTTATVHSVFNDDAATVDQKRTIADDATTFSKTEMGSGP